MQLRGLLFGTVIGLLLLSAGYATALLPNDDEPCGECASVGKRTSRKVQEPRPFREYPGWEYNDFPLPPDYKQPGEWVFARFMYRA
ncbi:MAG: hypothetical protein JO182_14190, partial [Acidobacteriaceae bacterium]|nr:hypothetical protein [Acidobacteriaceae bacterium]